MSNMAARADMEFVLLPVGICTPTDNRVSTHNYHWYKVNDGDDYFFRWRVGEKPAAANGDYTIWINEEPTAKNDWNQTTEETLTLSSQKTYKFAVVINTAAKTATYSIADEEGTVLKTGVHNYTCEENRAGIFVFGMNGTSTHQLSNIGLSYEAEGPFANEQTSVMVRHCTGFSLVMQKMLFPGKHTMMVKNMHLLTRMLMTIVILILVMVSVWVTKLSIVPYQVT